MADREKKEGQKKIEKFEYLENEQRFFGEIRKHFS